MSHRDEIWCRTSPGADVEARIAMRATGELEQILDVEQRVHPT